MRRLIVASRNDNKVKELQRIITELPYDVRSLAEYPDMPEVEETGATFVENACLKAQAAAEYTGCLALADDSGLVVDALDGAPGVRSARFAGAHGENQDKANNELLLQRLEGVPVHNRTARFVCAIAIADFHGIIWKGEGTVEGSISTRLQKGKYGFGYDPLFVPAGHTHSFAEMNDKQKDALSHRGKALRLAKKFLQGLTSDIESW